MDYHAIANRLLAQEQPRSAEFKAGLAAILQNRVDSSLVTSPYPAGTAQDDAFYAGRLRGHNEFRNLLLEHGNDHDAAVAALARFADRRVA